MAFIPAATVRFRFRRRERLRLGELGRYRGWQLNFFPTFSLLLLITDDFLTSVYSLYKLAQLYIVWYQKAVLNKQGQSQLQIEAQWNQACSLEIQFQDYDTRNQFQRNAVRTSRLTKSFSRFPWRTFTLHRITKRFLVWRVTLTKLVPSPNKPGVRVGVAKRPWHWFLWRPDLGLVERPNL